MDLSFIMQGDSIIIVFDLDDKKPESIKNLEIWNKLINDYKKKFIPIFLLPTKVDSLNKNQISKSFSNIPKICKKYNWILLENISCVNGNKTTFDSNMKIIIDNSIRNNKKKSDKEILEKTTTEVTDIKPCPFSY